MEMVELGIGLAIIGVERFQPKRLGFRFRLFFRLFISVYNRAGLRTSQQQKKNQKIKINIGAWLVEK